MPAPNGIPGSFAATPSFAPQPSAVIVGDATGVPAPSLLAAVAMRRGQPQGPTNDHEVEDFIYDAFELLPGAPMWKSVVKAGAPRYRQRAAQADQAGHR